MSGAGSCLPTTALPHLGPGPWCSPRARRSTLVPTSAVGHCSAFCVPMSIGGNSIGCVPCHDGGRCPALGHRGQANVEVVARRASERLAMLRAFEVSQTEANSDSLTGLMTRRSLEAAVRELRATGTQYSLAYGDLDHFKKLNDTFGHADRRPRAAHLLPGPPGLPPARRHRRVATGARSSSSCSPTARSAEAQQVLERVRERLADRIIMAAFRPSPSVSGWRHPTRARTSTHVVALADAALLSAKAGGRDQVVISDGPAPPVTNPAAASVRLEPRPRTNGGSPTEAALREHQHN